MRNYEDLPFAVLHAPVLDLLPDPGACVLDMAAGGLALRDAAKCIRHMPATFTT